MKAQVSIYEEFKVDGITILVLPSVLKNLKKFANDKRLFLFAINLSLSFGTIKIK